MMMMKDVRVKQRLFLLDVNQDEYSDSFQIHSSVSHTVYLGGPLGVFSTFGLFTKSFLYYFI